MDFLGAMFQGIGDTFKAGASVDVAKFAKETADKDRALSYYAFNEMDKANKYNSIAADARTEQNIIIAVLAFVAIVIGLIIYKSAIK